MSIGSELASELLAAITEYGRSVTLRKVTAGTYSNTTGSTSGGSTSDTAVVALLTSYNDRDVDGTRVLATDRKASIAASGVAVVPETGDRLIVGGVAYTIVSFQTIEAGGTAIAWVCQIRVG